MFRNLQKVARATRPVSKGHFAYTTRAFQHQTLIPIPPSSTVHQKLSLYRKYATSTNKDSKEPFFTRPATPEEIPWLDVLESSARAPWLNLLPSDPADRLKRAYILIFSITLYLGRPRSENYAEATQQFILAFESAPVSAGSEIARARHAAALLTRTVSDNITSVPLSSPLRTQFPQIFALADALVPLADVHLRGVKQGVAPTSGDVVDDGAKWQDFWARAQPVVLTLGVELDESGFGARGELERQGSPHEEKEDEKPETATKK